MKIEKGSLYINRTLIYLSPTLLVYGPLFRTKLSNVFSLAYGIHDCLLDGTQFETERKICILIDKSYQTAKYKDFMNWVKYQDFYLTDYLIGGFDSVQQMLVIKFPARYGEIHDKFIEGKYSKMFCKDEIRRFFPETAMTNDIAVARKEAREVITKAIPARDRFIGKVHDKYGTVVTLTDIHNEKPEYDFPPDKKEEFFNYKV
jgi:hypothetical protein